MSTSFQTIWGVSDRRPFTIILVALIILTWVVLWVWWQSPYGRFLYHGELGQIELFHQHGNEHLMLLLFFVVGWILMTIAMMLPTTLPLVTLFQTITSNRSDHTRLVIFLIIGYLSIWTLFGVIAHICVWGLRKAVMQSAWLEDNFWVLGATPILLAGFYQFTPLKYYCLEKCRSPLSFITQYWSGSHEWLQAFRLGVHHGIFCIGCCWSSMLLMFVIGAVNIGWMLALGL
jgi:predicted metal-binding membrane protein